MGLQNPGSGHVLVADDDPGVRYVIQWALENEGLDVKLAAGGDEAIDLLTEELPSLLVLDLKMPMRVGAEVARELRARDQDVPILVITGDGRASEKAQAVGAIGYLQKPFEVRELVSAVKRGLEAHP